jgi:hypothetical protein
MFLYNMRYSLRAFLVMALICPLIIGIGYKYAMRRRAEREMLIAGVSFASSDRVTPEGGLIVGRESGQDGPIALISLQGDGQQSARRKIAALRFLCRFNEVRHLDVSDVPLTDEDLVHITCLHQLETIDISHTDIDDHGIQILASMPALRLIVARGSRVTSAGVSAVVAVDPHLVVIVD